MTKTISQKYQAQYRSEKRKTATMRLGVVAVVLGAVVGGIYYWFFWSSAFGVKEIAIRQNSSTKEEEIRKVTDSYLEEKKWLVPRRRNILLVSEGGVAKRLAANFPALKNIKTEKKYWHGLIISAQKRETEGIWCFAKNGNCYYFDKEGLAFALAPESTGTLWVIVKDQRHQAVELGKEVGDSALRQQIAQLKQDLEKTKIGVVYLTIPEELFRINAVTTEGWQIYFNNGENLSEQVKTLNIFLGNKVAPEQRNLLQYVDLRVPNRVYFK